MNKTLDENFEVRIYEFEIDNQKNEITKTEKVNNAKIHFVKFTISKILEFMN